MSSNTARSARRAALRMPQTCVFCGVVFTRTRGTTRTITCSRSCSIKYSREAYRQYQAKERERTRKEKTCTVCGTIFTARKRSHVTCSKMCSVRHKHKWNNEYHARIQTMRETFRMMRKCRTCGVAFVWGATHKAYCSKPCRDRFASMRLLEQRAKDREAYRERDRKYNAEPARNEIKRRHQREHYAKHPEWFRERYRKKMLAYKALKKLGAIPDDLTSNQRLEFSYRILKQHFPGALPTNPKEKSHD